MSIFEERHTPSAERRTLFWLVCIIVRLLLATAFTVFSLYWNSWFPYVVGTVGIVGGLGFWVRRKTDNSEKIWWYRVVHGFFWLGGGISAIVLKQHGTSSDTAIAIAVFFYGDVLFGIGTALTVKTSWMRGYPNQRLVSFSGASLFSKESENAWLSKYSFVHAAFASAGAVAAYFALPDDPWVICLLLSFVVVGWEGFENVDLDFKLKWFGVGTIDYDANLAGDLIIGFAFLWGLAYILVSIH